MNTEDERERVTGILQQNLPNAAITDGNLTLLQRGNYGNANVYRYADGELDMVIKEFLSRSWIIRQTIGRFYIHREMKALTYLNPFPGVPGNPQRLGPYAFCCSYITGKTLSSLTKGSTKLPKTFFIELESRVRQLHEAGFAHLDVRNLGNIICSDDGQPFLIDFQSGVRTRRFSRLLLMIAQDADFSGVYKSWKKLCEEPLDPERAAFLEMVNRRRRLWVLKGYALRKATRRGKKKLRRRFHSIL